MLWETDVWAFRVASWIAFARVDPGDLVVGLGCVGLASRGLIGLIDSRAECLLRDVFDELSRRDRWFVESDSCQGRWVFAVV